MNYNSDLFLQTFILLVSQFQAANGLKNVNDLTAGMAALLKNTFTFMSH